MPRIRLDEAGPIEVMIEATKHVLSLAATHEHGSTAPTPWLSMTTEPLQRRDTYREAEPQSARVFGILFTIITAGICTSLFTQRVSAVRSWRRLSYIRWLVILQYAGAFIYILIAGVLQYGYDANRVNAACSGAAIICIVVYGLIKLFYLFLADRLHVVRSSTKSRSHSKLFLLHTTGITVGIIVMIIVFSFLRINDYQYGQCVIGVSRYIMLAGLCVDVLMNIYLTSFFLYYLSKTFSIRPSRGIRSPMDLISSGNTEPKVGAKIRGLAVRTVIGLAISLAATIANLTASIIRDGEVYWLCFLTCKADILVGVIVLYWVTGSRNREHPNPSSSYERSHTRVPPSPAPLDAIPLTSPSYEAHLRLSRRATAAGGEVDYDFDVISPSPGAGILPRTGSQSLAHPPPMPLGRVRTRERDF
ncbi:uncharacterized protein B0I36DRAFT_362440 [Microdochium trichocladiopsis]|uniref:Transmembrane protein n=1 Tax=Microdochium trichocladiopsis TaxID=1682393 RepID=A0A9P8Y3R6_9PEZI|nr:uncharacterized protein B0I36DRAFT_362440 [Microdochium trichocladiopsis]KAH7030607.1 hypothetical protein B0I36DRAFT_362440 [Microdochium trichocladiopsis]